MKARTEHLSADKRKDATIQAVLTLAGSQNPSKITTAAIAEHMNVTQGALFRHFPNKEAIWEAVLAWAAEKLISRIDKGTIEASSPLEALEVLFMSHVKFAMEHPGVPRMMFGELQRAGSTPAKCVVQKLIEQYRHRVQEIIKKGKKAGEIDSTLDVEAASILFIGTIQGLVMQSLIAGDLSRMQREATKVFKIYRRGISRGMS